METIAEEGNTYVPMRTWIVSSNPTIGWTSLQSVVSQCQLFSVFWRCFFFRIFFHFMRVWLEIFLTWICLSMFYMIRMKFDPKKSVLHQFFSPVHHLLHAWLFFFSHNNCMWVRSWSCSQILLFFFWKLWTLLIKCFRKDKKAPQCTSC